MSGLVLSLFPGIGLLDMAFEEEGFCVVRGPDLLWGGDIRKFRPPVGRFDGVIGGPPCQLFSQFRHINPHTGKHGNLIPEYERCVAEARPFWFVMENVKDAPEPSVDGYETRSEFLNPRWVGAEQNRLRRFTFGTRDLRARLGMGQGAAAFKISTEVFEPMLEAQAVTSAHELAPVKLGGGGKVKKSWRPPTVPAGHGAAFSHERGNITLARMCELQGLPEGFLQGDDCPMTSHGKRKCIGNGVPLPMGRAVAKAVKAALNQQEAAA
jgi:DNA (cytosine-5)-methyltransferase 1